MLFLKVKSLIPFPTSMKPIFIKNKRGVLRPWCCFQPQTGMQHVPENLGNCPQDYVAKQITVLFFTDMNMSIFSKDIHFFVSIYIKRYTY
jgi:hypothetical protein